uniref:Uncharacterized protein n=1 Tax=Romanomermis culicivorax TaxID=13658 RepID=A0A915KPV0_ROMCU
FNQKVPFEAVEEKRWVYQRIVAGTEILSDFAPKNIIYCKIFSKISKKTSVCACSRDQKIEHVLIWRARASAYAQASSHENMNPFILFGALGSWSWS